MELARWLMDHPHVDDDGTAFMHALHAKLRAAGLPIWRISYALTTKHPELLWRTVQSASDGDVVVRDQPHARLADDFYRKSAVALARESGATVRVRLDGSDARFPIAADLRALGGTDYLVEPLAYANGEIGYVSFATQQDGGFLEADLAELAALRPFLARRIELESAYHATRALLDVYLGRNAARRVFAGAFQRGRGERIDAAIWFSDMRDFTVLSDTTPPEELVELLDRYFDAVASAVAERGGEVLKFIGDAVLAIFPLGDDPARACNDALAAAEAAFTALAALNRDRATPIAIGVGLHRGEVLYGNVGARDRLDFTVISAAVNEASRLESLCKKLGTSLAMSEAFARTAGVADTVDLGAQELKGVKAPLRVLTLARYRT